MFFTTHALSIMDMPDLATPTNDTLAGTARTYVPILTEEDCLRKSFRNKEHVAPYNPPELIFPLVLKPACLID
jgi:hypothetical protein